MGHRPIQQKNGPYHGLPSYNTDYGEETGDGDSLFFFYFFFFKKGVKTLFIITEKRCTCTSPYIMISVKVLPPPPHPCWLIMCYPNVKCDIQASFYP